MSLDLSHLRHCRESESVLIFFVCHHLTTACNKKTQQNQQMFKTALRRTHCVDGGWGYCKTASKCLVYDLLDAPNKIEILQSKLGVVYKYNI